MKSRVIRISAPAKLNLGLAITARRQDGYHTISTVMAMIDLRDQLQFEFDHGSDITISGMADVPAEHNLISRAIRLFQDAADRTFSVVTTVHKMIPSPGGLGGASSDAAATLLALNTAFDSPLEQDVLHTLAASLGADCPFFLGNPVQLASGIGTTLSPLPPLAGHAVIVVPPLVSDEKTGQMYKALRCGDFNDGASVARVADVVRAGSLPNPQDLTNSFERPLGELFPASRDVSRMMHEAGFPYSALSGAGPARYALVDSSDEAARLAKTIRPSLPQDVPVFAVPLRTHPLAPEFVGQ